MEGDVQVNCASCKSETAQGYRLPIGVSHSGAEGAFHFGAQLCLACFRELAGGIEAPVSTAVMKPGEHLIWRLAAPTEGSRVIAAIAVTGVEHLHVSFNEESGEAVLRLKYLRPVGVSPDRN